MDQSVGITGAFGLKTTDMHHFYDGANENVKEMDAIITNDLSLKDTGFNFLPILQIF